MTGIAVLRSTPRVAETFAPLTFWSKYEKFYYARWYTQTKDNLIKEVEY